MIMMQIMMIIIMKIKIISDDDLPLSRLFLSDVVILIRSVFEDNGTYYPQLFLEKAFYDEEKSSLFKFNLIQHKTTNT